MIKKIILFFVVFFLFIGHSFAWKSMTYELDWQWYYVPAAEFIGKDFQSQAEADEFSRNYIASKWWTTIADSSKLLASTNDIRKVDFMIDTTSLLWVNRLKDDGWNAKKTLNTTLWTIIQKLMIWLGSISLLIMSIWAWFMILYSGHDELLSKWKSIFNAWIIALVVALLSYYLVSLLRFVLYTQT